MRKLFLILCLMSSCFYAKAQQNFSAEELQQVDKLLKSPQLRKPLPYMMSSDQRCYDAVFELAKLDDARMKLLADSMRIRYEENEFLLPRIKYVVKDTVQRRRTTQRVEGEQLRYKCFTDECRLIEANRLAEQREEPKAELIYVKLSISGMAHNPRMPMSIEKGEDDYDIGKTGWKEAPCKVSKDALRQVGELLAKGKFYKLHPSYEFHRVNLPNIPMVEMLDGEHWSLVFMYADGTRISSSGSHRPEQELGELEKLLDELIPGGRLE